MYCIGCSPKTSTFQSPRSMKSGLVFALTEHTTTMLQPIDQSRRSQPSNPSTKSMVAESLATSLLNVVSTQQTLPHKNQVLRSGHWGSRRQDPAKDGDFAVGLKQNLGDNHTICSQKAFDAKPTSSSLLTPLEPQHTLADTNSQQQPPPQRPSHILVENRTGYMGQRIRHQDFVNVAARRNRSPAIAMKKKKPDPKLEADQAALANAVREYDWATWRLYDKIISHRQQRNQILQEQLPDTVCSSDDGFGSIVGRTSNATHFPNEEFVDSTHLVEEGIFEIDL